MKIERLDLLSRLEEFALSGSGVIVGCPGVGKSYALGELRERLKAQNVPHLVLPVERLGDGTEADLKALLKREGDFIEMLDEVTKKAPQKRAVLIFDGFDAARGEAQRAGTLRLIRRAVTELKGSWNTIVSVRLFDARKSLQLLELFPEPLGETGKLETKCRHFLIPQLTFSELEQAFGQYPSIAQLYQQGSDDFRNLLLMPFNLWLVEKMLRAGVQVAELSQMISEVQLLETYWRKRVSSHRDGEDRNFLLARATRAMISAHTLSVRKEVVYEPHARVAWEGLLSDEILAESNENETFVAYTHNILFDFAISKLLLDREPNQFAAFVAEEPARPLFLRPSLVYHFTSLWHYDRDCFWRNFWSVVAREEAHLRQIIRLVLPAVIVNELRTLADVAPVFLSLAQGDSGGATATSFMIQALRVLKPKNVELWAGFIRQLAAYPKREFAWDAGVVARGWLDQNTVPSVRESCGEYGRSLLRWSWAQRSGTSRVWFERLAGLVAIPLVSKTFDTNSTDSFDLLVRVLDALEEENFPIDCIFRLSNEVENLIEPAPNLVGLIYERVFGHEEESQEQTNMGGPVMPLISNRRQDFDSCQYSLLQDYSKFVSHSPAIAVRSGIKALHSFILHDHFSRGRGAGRSIDEIQQFFMFRDSRVRYIPDGSAIWDEGRHPDQELQLADDLFAWFRTKAQDGDINEVAEILEIFAKEAAFAFFWKRLLHIGSEAPVAIGKFLWEICLAIPILKGSDVLYELCSFLEKVVPFLERGQREKIERKILELPGTVTGDEYADRVLHRRDRLIGSIAPGALVTQEGIELYRKLESENALISNRPSFQVSAEWSKVTEDDILEGQGANSDLPENLALKELYRPLKDWNDKGHDEEEIDGLLPVAESLRDVLCANPTAESPVVLAAWIHLSDFATNALRKTTQVGTSRFSTLRDLILLAAGHSEPLPDPKFDDNWTNACWSPAPRTEAAEALPWLSHLQSDQMVLSAVQNLTFDPVPSVRFIIAHDLWRVGENAPDLMWQFLERLVEEESNVVVLKGVTASLAYTSRWDKPRTLELVKKLLLRSENDPDEDRGFRNDAVRILTDYAVMERESSAMEILSDWRAKPLEYFSELSTSGHRLIEYIRPQQSADSFEQARKLLLLHLDAAALGLADLQIIAEANGEKVSPGMWRGLYGILDQAVLRIYFGADLKPNLRQRAEFPLDDITRPKFFRDALPILEKILSFGAQPSTGMLLAPTAHHFMELLNGVLQYAPSLVLSLAAQVVDSSKRFNYTLDSMAMKETVTLVEAILADYRSDVQDDASLQNLLNILDAFVNVGWPEALSLVWRLDEVYR